MVQSFQASSLRTRIPDQIPGATARELLTLSRQSAKVGDGQFSATFWETLYEQVRSTERPNCPTRLKSYFGSKDIHSLSRYRDSHWRDKMGDKVACEINVSACNVVFEADMVVLDRVTEDMNYETARSHILRYWDQEVSDDPNMELLLQGKVVLGQRVNLN